MQTHDAQMQVRCMPGCLYFQLQSQCGKRYVQIQFRTCCCSFLLLLFVISGVLTTLTRSLSMGVIVSILISCYPHILQPRPRVPQSRCCPRHSSTEECRSYDAAPLTPDLVCKLKELYFLRQTHDFI